MTSTGKSAVATYRDRMKRRGLVRVEVQVRREDAGLVRDVASALADPAREVETRALLRDRIGRRPASGLKALLASAPLDGIEVDRPHDVGREIDL